MRRARTAIAGALGAVVVLVATACYPPSQTPTAQSIPPGGRVVATAATLKEMWIEDATADLSEILYAQDDFVATLNHLANPSSPVPYAFWVYDDITGHTTQIPNGHGTYGSASLSRDGRSVVFESNDPALQVGPTALNCGYTPYPTPRPTTMCGELYLFDLDTGQTRQLTGLNGSSEVDNESPTFTDDGQSIDFTTIDSSQYNPVYKYERLDLATGQVEATAPTGLPTSWDRGTNHISWDFATGTLTSEDTTTGVVTTLWSNPTAYALTAAIDNGKFLVISDWVTGQRQVFDLIDTDTGTIRQVSSQWISEDGSHYATVQVNVAPDGIDRLVIAPLPPA